MTIYHISDLAERIKSLESQLDQQKFNNKHNLSIDQSVADKIIDLESKLTNILAYCEPHQEFMWAKYITGIAKGKKDWRDL